MRIIGLHGRAGSGKDTFADAFIGRDVGLRVGKIGFANAVRDVAEVLFGERYESQDEKLAIDEYWDPRLRRPLDPHNYCGACNEPGEIYLGNEPVTGRRVLQFIGTELGRDHIHPDIWVMVLERRLKMAEKKYDVVVVTDVRFDNEAWMLRKLGGKILHLINLNHKPLPTGAHRSEQPISLSLCNETFYAAEAGFIRDYARDMAARLSEEVSRERA